MLGSQCPPAGAHPSPALQQTTQTVRGLLVLQATPPQNLPRTLGGEHWAVGPSPLQASPPKFPAARAHGGPATGGDNPAGVPSTAGPRSPPGRAGRGQQEGCSPPGRGGTRLRKSFFCWREGLSCTVPRGRGGSEPPLFGGEQTAAAGGWRHAPPCPSSQRFSPKASTPGGAQRGLRAAPKDRIAAEHLLWDRFSHSHTKQPQKAKLQGANQGKAGRSVTLQPSDTAPCPTTGGQILTYKQQPEEQRSTCNRITRGHSPPSCLLLHTHVSPDTLQRGCVASMCALPPQPRRHNDGLKKTHVPVIHSAAAY